MKVLIKNGSIYDGTGSDPFYGSILINDDRIAEIIKGDVADAVPELLDNADTIIDANGRCVTPGFIDQHRHADLAIFRDSFGPQELSQGITTIGTGVCGFSYAPFTEKSEGLYNYFHIY